MRKTEALGRYLVVSGQKKANPGLCVPNEDWCSLHPRLLSTAGELRLSGRKTDVPTAREALRYRLPVKPPEWWDNRSNKKRDPSEVNGTSVEDLCLEPKFGIWQHPPSHHPQQHLGRVAKQGNQLSAEIWSKLCDGQVDEAFQALQSAKNHDLSHVHRDILYSLLKRCMAKKDIVISRRVHGFIVRSRDEMDPFLANHIIRMYASHGSLDEASRVFYQLPAPDKFAWASIISAHGELGEPELAIDKYKEMRGVPFAPHDHLFVVALKACASAANLKSGKLVHADIVECGLESNIFVGSTVVDMYAKCGSLQDARIVFDRLPMKNVVTWSAMITGYSQQGLGHEVLQLYAGMRQDGITPSNCATFLALLKACASTVSLHVGQQVHAQILDKGLESDIRVGSTLVDMYAKCGSLTDARIVFDRLSTKNLVTWNCMISGYVQHGLGQEALFLFQRMQQYGVMPDEVTYVSVLKACAGMASLKEGKEIHVEILSRGLEADTFVGNTLVHMYAKCGTLQDARVVFDRMLSKDVVTWNCMVEAFTCDGLYEEALNLYGRMLLIDVQPDKATFLSILKACGSMQNLLEGRQIHAEVQRRGLVADVCVGSSLVDMYVKCGSLMDGRSVFDKLSTKNVITWSAMIGGYVQHGLGQEALKLYEEMQQLGVIPDVVTFTGILKACASMGAVQKGQQIHARILEMGLEADPSVGNGLVDMYSKCGSVVDARTVFDRLPTKNVVTWSAMIAGYSHSTSADEALILYDTMQQTGITPANNVTFVCLLKACAGVGALRKGQEIHAEILEQGLEADVCIGCSLVDMYAKCGSLEIARTLFDRLPTRDLMTWSAMISGYTQAGLGQEALNIYASMHQAGVVPDKVALVSVLKACSSAGALQTGKQIHEDIQARGLEADGCVGTTLVDMYAKCGTLTDARLLFDRLPVKDVVTWNALINGYGQHNDSNMAIQCFEEMQQQGVEPDGTTFLGLLVACSHVGLVAKGEQYFKSMTQDHGISPTIEHYTCMVDLLGRAGRLDEAETILRTLPFDQDPVGWRCLLTACKAHGDTDRGRRCFNHLRILQPHQGAGYALMSSLYADADSWTQVDGVQDIQMRAGAQKKPAKTLLQINNEVLEFVVGEERADTSSKLKSMNLRLKERGHIPHTELVLRPLPELEKEDALCGHAEKLALAYGLLNTPDGTTLLVTKNLRMCNDCHSGTKTLSRIENREIIVRDAHKVHHFRDGLCSCGDSL